MLLLLVFLLEATIAVLFLAYTDQVRPPTGTPAVQGLVWLLMPSTLNCSCYDGSSLSGASRWLWEPPPGPTFPLHPMGASLFRAQPLWPPKIPRAPLVLSRPSRGSSRSLVPSWGVGFIDWGLGLVVPKETCVS